MKTFIVTLKCEGNEKHSPHETPMLIISMSTSKGDLPKIASLEMALAISEPEEDVVELLRGEEDIVEIAKAISNILVGTEKDSEKDFDKVGEVDSKVDFRS